MSDTENPESSFMDLEKLLEQKEKLEGIIRDKFTKVVTVMFTDLKGSTTIAEKHGDLSSRGLIRDHNNIVFPAIKENNGILVKSMGDGTLSYFPDALDALRAASSIQRGFVEYNNLKKLQEPVFIRVGMHTGSVLIEKDDIFGDVVNTASRFESSASPGTIQLSEETYTALSDKDEIVCRFIREAALKGKKQPFRIYKAYWDPDELEKDIEEERLRTASDITEETIMVTRDAEVPDTSEAKGFTDSPDTSASIEMSAGDEADILKQAEMFDKEREAIRMFLLLNKHSSYPAVGSIIPDMCQELRNNSPHEIMFYGEKALWFYKSTITTGRLQDADFPVTNKAVSRTPVNIGIRDGESFLKIKASEGDKVNIIEIEAGDEKKEVSPNVEYTLGESGRIIFSSCFPVEYKIFKERFLVLRFLAMEECVESVMNMSLRDVWSNFESESGRLVIIGI